MFHTLATHEDLEEMRTALAAKLKRPVYIASGTRKSNGTHFKRPRSMKYGPIGALELYLSTLTDHGTCVKRVKVEGSMNDHFYFDLAEADFLHLIYPLTDEESKLPDIRNAFKSVGLGDNIHGPENVYPSSNEPLPPELEKYLRPKKVRANDAKRMAILFARSEYIASPNKLHERWHRGLRVEGKYAPTFVTLQAPGWYHGKPVTTVEGVNRFGLVDTDPGPCTVCHGKSGDRRHIAPVQSAGQDAYLAGHLCKTCAKDAFAQWTAMLDDATPV